MVNACHIQGHLHWPMDLLESFLNTHVYSLLTSAWLSKEGEWGDDTFTFLFWEIYLEKFYQKILKSMENSHILSTARMLVFLPFWAHSSSRRRGTLREEGPSSGLKIGLLMGIKGARLMKNSSENCLSVKSEQRSKTFTN